MTQPAPDLHLVHAYVSQASQEAFAELVRRHAGWVYAVARRRVGDGHLAEDVTQAVFLVLARKGGQLRTGTVLSAWLFEVTRLACSRTLRDRARRERREAEARMQIQAQTSAGPDHDSLWREISPMLDDAVARLRHGDRSAVLLRFYEQKSFEQVAAEIGGTAEAARKRVVRALERLRKMLSARMSKDRAALLAVALAELMRARAADAAPPGSVVASAIEIGLSTGAALPAASSTLAQGVIAMTRWFRIKIALAAIVVLLLIAGLTGLGLVARAEEKTPGKPLETGATPAAPVKKVLAIIPILLVQDVPASIDFYENKIGLPKQWTWGDPVDFASVGRDQYCVFLQQNFQEKLPHQTVYITVDDVDALHAHLKSAGVEIVQPPTDCAWNMRETVVRDPDGHTLRIGTPLTNLGSGTTKPN